MSRRHVGPVIRLALSPSQAATALGVSYQFCIRPAIERGELPVHLIQGRNRIAVADLEKFLRSHAVVTSLARRKTT